MKKQSNTLIQFEKLLKQNIKNLEEDIARQKQLFRAIKEEKIEVMYGESNRNYQELRKRAKELEESLDDAERKLKSYKNVLEMIQLRKEQNSQQM